MTRKSKMVLKRIRHNDRFEIVKTVNTLQYGVPGEDLTRKEIDSIMKSNADFRRGDFVIEFIKGD